MEDVTRLSRRTSLAALGGAAAVSLVSERARAAQAPRGGATRLLAIPGDGPVLGMSREDWVAAMGPGEQVDAGLGDDMYVYGAQNGMLYVTFRKFTDGAFANYIEFQIGGDGLPYSQVDPMARSMMPADADATDSYLAPATPGGPTAIATWRYTSEELDAVHPGIPGTFLSLWMQRRGDDNAWLVSSMHLIAGDIMQ